MIKLDRVFADFSPKANPAKIAVYKSFWYFLLSFESIGISVQEKFKIDFQDGRRCGCLGFPVEMILATLIFKSPWYFLPSFKSMGLSVQEKILAGLIYKSPQYFLPSFESIAISAISRGEIQNKFSWWRSWWSSWISSWNAFSYFLSTSHPDTSYHVLGQWAFRFRKRRSKWIFLFLIILSMGAKPF